MAGYSDDKNKELYDIQAESIWIATAISHPEFLRIENNVKPGFFYNQANQCLVWAIQQLAIVKGVDTIDALNLQTMISSNKAVERIIDGSIPSLQEFIDDAKYAARSTYEEFKMNEDIILTYSFKRELQKFSHMLGNECSNPNVSLEQLNDMCNDGIDKIVTKYVFGADSCEIGQEIDDAWQEIVSKRTENGYGIPYLIPRINEFTSLVGGEMDLLMGKTGKGKSSFFLCQALYCALTLNVPTLIIDSELTTEVWLPRALASVSGVPVWKIKTGKYDTSEEKNNVTKAMEKLRKAHIVHYFLPQFNNLTIEQVSRKWVNKGYQLIILDYIKPDARYDAAGLSQSLGLQADFMKGLAGRLNVAVLCGLQQNKLTGEAADSQKPERMADCFMAWEEKTPQEIAANPKSGNYKISVLKNRNNGVTDEETYIDVNFQKDIMRIGPAEMHTVSSDVNPFEDK